MSEPNREASAISSTISLSSEEILPSRTLRSTFEDGSGASSSSHSKKTRQEDEPLF